MPEPVEPTVSAETLERITAIVNAPVTEGQAQAAFATKERELLHLIQKLSPAEAFALRRRLQIDRQSDPLAGMFRRFTIERRDRLMAFLLDPGREFRQLD
jgi:hypothetical protein